MAKGYRLEEIERERGEKLETLIPRLYNQFGNDDAVAAELKCHPNTIKRWRRMNGYVRRPTAHLVLEANHDAAH